VRERYGRNIHGQCLLLARRLIEAGVRLVEVNWHQDHRAFWDTHGDNFRRLKRDLMPPADQGFSALLDDLAQRGLLNETLVIWVGEFGRKPVITRNNAGREHHPWCYSAVLAGGGIRGGQLYGKSDRIAARPAENPVSPADLTATVYHALGIAPEMHLEDREGRMIRLTEGSPVLSLFA
jgi:arylsulfatase A-like enzyme